MTGFRTHNDKGNVTTLSDANQFIDQFIFINHCITHAPSN